jgi:hypothetical protein
VNLDVIIVLVVISNHELRFRVVEWDRERVAGMFCLVNFDRFFIVRVGGDCIDDGPLEDDLWEDGSIKRFLKARNFCSNLTESHRLFAEVTTECLRSDVTVPQDLGGTDSPTRNNKSLEEVNT